MIHNPKLPSRKAEISFHKFTYLLDLLHELIKREMKLRYKRSFLGLFWSLANPLGQILVLSFVFQYILPTKVENFTLFLFIGVLAWNWFRSSLYAATGSIVNNQRLINRPEFPVGVLPIVTVTTYLLHFILAIPILILFLFLAKTPISNALYLLPFVILVQFLLTLSLAYILSAVHVTFRDTQYLLEIFLMFGFYLSPIFYGPNSVPEQYLFYYSLNPMVPIITAYRDILLRGEVPPLPNLIAVALLSVLLMGIGYSIFKQASFRFVEEI